ncbi:MAG: immunoglobulin domain-containing protein, partial [Verrucomicrobiota bacterium]
MISNRYRLVALSLRLSGLILVSLPLTSRALTATATPGQTVSFTVTAEGDQPFTYRWFKDGQELAGATAAEFVINGASTGDAGTFVAEVRNPQGATLSEPAILTVAPADTAPVITNSPVSQTVFAGAAVTFSGSATGSPAPTYQWLKDGTPLAGATANTLTLAAAALSDAGTYSVTATNSVGSVTSAPAVLTVNPPLTAPVFTLQPVSQNVTEGGSVAFTTAASGNPAPTFQWYQDGNAIAGATAASYGITNAVAGSAGAYTVVAQNSVGSTTSAIALLTVSPAPAAPVITTQPLSQTVAAGATVTFTVVATGNPAPSYRWFVQVKSGRTVTKTYLAGATSPSLTLANVTTANAGTYAVDVANSAGTVTSAGAVLKVTTTGGKAPKSQTNLVGGTTVATALPGRFADTLRVDFNADQRADLVFHHLPSGGAKAWLLSDATRAAELVLPSPAKGWRLVTAADFNGDGRADL